MLDHPKLFVFSSRASNILHIYINSETQLGFYVCFAIEHLPLPPKQLHHQNPCDIYNLAVFNAVASSVLDLKSTDPNYLSDMAFFASSDGARNFWTPTLTSSTHPHIFSWRSQKTFHTKRPDHLWPSRAISKMSIQHMLFFHSIYFTVFISHRMGSV